MNMLQVNTSGAWKHVLQFPDARESDVREHAAILGKIGRLKWRILGEDDEPRAWWSEERPYWHRLDGTKVGIE